MRFQGEERRNGKERRANLFYDRIAVHPIKNVRKQFDRRGQVTAEQLAEFLKKELLHNGSTFFRFDRLVGWDNSNTDTNVKAILDFIRKVGER